MQNMRIYNEIYYIDFTDNETRKSAARKKIIAEIIRFLPYSNSSRKN
jgi:hypothetical protein